MTCRPASRRARATTLMPRSWPSRPTLARTTRTGGADVMFAYPRSLEESPDGGAELGKDFGQGQLLVAGEDLFLFLTPVDPGRLRLLVEDAHHGHSCFEVLSDL